MAERTIDDSGRDVPRKLKDSGVAAEQQEHETPVWHSIVGEGWEPVQFGELTKAGEQELWSTGWVTQRGGGCSYGKGMLPRRRRKRRMVTWRLCALLRYDPDSMSKRVNLEWLPSDEIEAPWCALETQTNPFETVKTLPEGEEP